MNKITYEQQHLDRILGTQARKIFIAFSSKWIPKRSARNDECPKEKRSWPEKEMCYHTFGFCLRHHQAWKPSPLCPDKLQFNPTLLNHSQWRFESWSPKSDGRSLLITRSINAAVRKWPVAKPRPFDVKAMPVILSPWPLSVLRSRWWCWCGCA